MHWILLGLCLLQICFGLAGPQRTFSQPTPEKEYPVKLGAITFQKRTVGTESFPLKVLEVQIEVFNPSRQADIPPGSVRIVVSPKEVISPDGSLLRGFAPSPEEAILNLPLAPQSGRLLVVGFAIPEQKPKSIAFEVQINPPRGERALVTWEED